MGSYVGIDLQRQRSVVVVLNEDGDRVSCTEPRLPGAGLGVSLM